ncbi:hypothetical protein HDU93_006887, partial [Gonapodya sp. JEL0774]
MTGGEAGTRDIALSLNKATSSKNFVPTLNRLVSEMLRNGHWEPGAVVDDLLGEMAQLTMETVMTTVYGISRDCKQFGRYVELMMRLDPEKSLNNPRSFYARQSLVDDLAPGY